MTFEAAEHCKQVAISDSNQKKMFKVLGVST